MIETFTTGIFSGVCLLLGGLVIKQNNKRIDRCEEKQDKHTAVIGEIHFKVGEIAGKLDTAINLIKRSGHDKK